jgi:hypothetical protein
MHNRQPGPFLDHAALIPRYNIGIRSSEHLTVRVNHPLPEELLSRLFGLDLSRGSEHTSEIDRDVLIITGLIKSTQSNKLANKEACLCSAQFGSYAPARSIHDTVDLVGYGDPRFANRLLAKLLHVIGTLTMRLAVPCGLEVLIWMTLKSMIVDLVQRMRC